MENIPNRIIFHVTDSDDSLSLKTDQIRRWHMTDPDRMYDDIGYHYVVEKSGNIGHGRLETTMGAHTLGQNHHSLGICWVGQSRMNGKQLESLYNLTVVLMKRHRIPSHLLYAHHEFNKGKTCPNFPIIMFREYIRLRQELEAKQVTEAEQVKNDKSKEQDKHTVESVGLFHKLFQWLLKIF